MYSSFDEILAELKARKNDPELKKKVDSFFKECGLPYERKPEHRAFFSRSVMSPNYEMMYFMDLSRDLGLEPLLLEYPDKFVAKNPAKYCLSRFHFHEDEKRFILQSGLKLIDIASMEGKRFPDIVTIHGDNFMNFHHELLFKEYPVLETRIVDFYHWFNTTRGVGEDYYLKYLSLFIYDGVLFENFLHDDKEETEFVLKKILPSFNKACEIFGVKPLIFPLLPIKYEKQKDWLAYPPSIKDKIELYLKK